MGFCVSPHWDPILRTETTPKWRRHRGTSHGIAPRWSSLNRRVALGTPPAARCSCQWHWPPGGWIGRLGGDMLKGGTPGGDHNVFFGQAPRIVRKWSCKPHTLPPCPWLFLPCRLVVVLLPSIGTHMKFLRIHGAMLIWIRLVGAFLGNTAVETGRFLKRFVSALEKKRKNHRPAEKEPTSRRLLYKKV